VLMSAGSMDMAVGELILGGFSYVDDIDIEIERDPSQRVVGIDADRVVLYADDGDDLHLPLRALSAKLHAGLDVLHALKCLAGNFLDKLVIAHSVRLLWRDCHDHLLAL